MMGVAPRSLTPFATLVGNSRVGEAPHWLQIDHVAGVRPPMDVVNESSSARLRPGHIDTPSATVRCPALAATPKVPRPKAMAMVAATVILPRLLIVGSPSHTSV